MLAHAEGCGSDQDKISGGGCSNTRAAVEHQLERPGEMQRGKAVGRRVGLADMGGSDGGKEVVEKGREERGQNQGQEAGHTLLREAEDQGRESGQREVNAPEESVNRGVLKSPMIDGDAETAVQATEERIDGMRLQVSDEGIEDSDKTDAQGQGQSKKDQLQARRIIALGEEQKQKGARQRCEVKRVSGEDRYQKEICRKCQGNGDTENPVKSTFLHREADAFIKVTTW